MSHILFPASANAQGYAFESLVHRLLPKVGHEILQPSNWYHFDKTWYQLDGMVKHQNERWLLEIKFTKTDLNKQIVDFERRIACMRAADCQGMFYVSPLPLTDKLAEKHHADDIRFHHVSWDELKPSLPGDSPHLTCLLDPIEVTDTHLAYQQRKLMYAAENTASHGTFPEFIVFPDEAEKWVRRLPYFEAYEKAIAPGCYEIADGLLKPYLTQHLSIEEAWSIQDSFSGYANRVLSSVEPTLKALQIIGSGTAKQVQQALPEGISTGVDGVRSSLVNLALWKLVQRWQAGRNVNFSLTPLGRAMIAGGSLDAELLREVLEAWLPYRYFKKFLEQGHYGLDAQEIIAWFQMQYAAYWPYAKSLFNPNKVEGLMHIYRKLAEYSGYKDNLNG